MQGNLQGDDPYDYVGGNPETNTDPSGHRLLGGDGDGRDHQWAYINTDGSISGMDITPSGVPYTFSYPPASEAPTITYESWPPVAVHTHQQPAAASTPHKVVTKPAEPPNPMIEYAKSGAHLLYQRVDLFLDLSSMAHDWTTLMGNGSWWDKTLAAGDLALNLGMDVSMIFGIGEELRGGELAIKGGADLAEHLAADSAEHGGEDLAEHAGEACGGLSFAFATRVATAPGSQSIGSLKPGEKVWAYNTKTQKMELEPVLHVWINHDDDLVDLTISTPTTAKKGTTSEVIHTNKKHPFLTEEQGFVPVSDLHVGMHVREANGSYGQITGWYVVLGTMTMYNLEVQQDHTYTVGDGQWVVHNSCYQGFDNAVKLANHTDKHAADFGLAADDMEGYDKGSMSFFEGNTHDGSFGQHLQRTRANGDEVHFNTSTNEFGVVSNTGVTKSWYKPDMNIIGPRGYTSPLDYFFRSM